MTKPLLILILLIVFGNCFAQSKQQTGTHEIAFQLFNSEKFDSAIFYFKKLEKKYSQNKQLGSQASIIAHLGISYYRIGMPDSSLYYYEQAIQLYEKEGDNSGKALIQLNSAIVHKSRGSYEKALELLFEAVNQLQHDQNSEALASSYNTIALIYSRQKDYERSLEYHYRTLMLARANQDFKTQAATLNNIGLTYQKLNQLDSAYSNFEKAFIIKDRHGSDKSQISTLNNLGLILIEFKELDKAKTMLTKAKLLNTNSADESLAVSYNGMGSLSIELKDYSSASKYLDSANYIIDQLNLVDLKKDNLLLKVKLYSIIDKTEALNYYQQLQEVSDSIYNRDRISALFEMQTKYETEKQAQSIQVLEAEKELQKVELETNRLGVLILSVVVLLVIIIAYLLYNKFRSEKRNKLKVEMLMQELHHRVKNNLQLLSSIFSLQSKTLTDLNALEAVKTSENRVNAMAIVHQKLYSRSEARNINIHDYLHDLIEQLAESFTIDTEGNNIDVQVEKLDIDLDKIIAIGLIVNEVVSNAFKHAFKASVKSELWVNVFQNNHELFIEIKDNGTGFDINASRKSMGLNIIETLSRQLRATVNWKVNNGTLFKLKMKLN
ncbi:MAG: tetratricopeptide repeat protein [Fulvivirga sp.]|uniref:tetratricopeptide repeat-containing sensor histidine kinase n=1 Tax=Fulvivirga sp. TaxID=1931237 RepID=UPI0032EDAE65